MAVDLNKLTEIGAPQGHTLDGDAFTEEMAATINQNTGLVKSDWLGDWWVHPEGNPQLTWAELIDLAVGILCCDVTRLFVTSSHLEEKPTYKVRSDQSLPDYSVRGSKRVNARRGEWHDFSGLTGMGALQRIARGENLEQALIARAKEPTLDSGDRFRLHGKDESCLVEGTWRDWVCFACNILASKNTELACPELFAPHLANQNY